MDSAEILHDCPLGGKDQVHRIITVTLQHCSIQCSAAESLNTLWPISEPFLNGFSWNFAWLLFRWKGSSLDLKQWPCSFSAQCSAAESSSQPFFNQLVTPVVAYSNCSDFFSNSSVKTTKVFKLQQGGFVSHCQHFSQLSWFFGNPPWW